MGMGGEDEMAVDGGEDTEEDVVPTVCPWEHGGRQVYIQGNFNNWEGRSPCPARGTTSPTSTFSSITCQVRQEHCSCCAIVISYSDVLATHTSNSGSPARSSSPPAPSPLGTLDPPRARMTTQAFPF